MAENITCVLKIYEVFTDIARNGLLTVPAANDVLRILQLLTINCSTQETKIPTRNVLPKRQLMRSLMVCSC